jgi:hypothetical protein
MTKLTVRDYNDETKQIIEREFTAEELAQYELDKANAAKSKAEAEAKAQAKATAEGKLAALGLTTDDLRALGL